MNFRFALLLICLGYWDMVYSQGQYGCYCTETLNVIEVTPEQPRGMLSFKRQLAEYMDTSGFCGPDTGSFIVSFTVDRCGDIKDMNVVYSSTGLSELALNALPRSGKWRPGNNGGKICCVRVALKFEMYNKEWHIKRLVPFSFEVDNRSYFQE